MDGAELVRRGDEQHLREIDRNLQVVVAERVVLRRVEHFEQRRGGIALHADRDLVDLVEHQHRVRRAGRLQRLHQPARHRADVGAAMTANLRFVADAAERDAHELAVHRARDRLAERRLADSRRADEAEDRSLQVPFQLPHREVLDDSLLDLVEIVVVLVEHPARLDRIEPVFRRLVPRDVEDPVEIRADHLVLGRCGRHALEPIDFAAGDRRHRLRAAGVRPPACAAPAPSPSPSPSSVWMAFICWRSTYCRCASVISFSALRLDLALSARAPRSRATAPSRPRRA